MSHLEARETVAQKCAWEANPSTDDEVDMYADVAMSAIRARDVAIADALAEILRRGGEHGTDLAAAVSTIADVAALSAALRGAP